MSTWLAAVGFLGDRGPWPAGRAAWVGSRLTTAIRKRPLSPTVSTFVNAVYLGEKRRLVSAMAVREIVYGSHRSRTGQHVPTVPGHLSIEWHEC